MASAMSMAMPHLSEAQKQPARRYAQDQLDWILGLNPFDMCMLDGAGRNNPPYHESGGNLNYRGGVCNGITGADDETDIAFMPASYDDLSNRWRWAEQWLPHSSWLMLALAASLAD
jgi:predicted O-methyltransferase YrrM